LLLPLLLLLPITMSPSCGSSMLVFFFLLAEGFEEEEELWSGGLDEEEFLQLNLHVQSRLQKFAISEAKHLALGFSSAKCDKAEAGSMFLLLLLLLFPPHPSSSLTTLNHHPFGHLCLPLLKL